MRSPVAQGVQMNEDSQRMKKAVLACAGPLFRTVQIRSGVSLTSVSLKVSIDVPLRESWHSLCNDRRQDASITFNHAASRRVVRVLRPSAGTARAFVLSLVFQSTHNVSTGLSKRRRALLQRRLCFLTTTLPACVSPVLAECTRAAQKPSRAVTRAGCPGTHAAVGAFLPRR